MYMEELTRYGLLNDTLVIFTSDNGIPFPNAKTNLYESGMGEPMLVSSPYHTQRWGEISEALTSTLYITPTVLDWFNLSYPNYKILGKKANLTGKSMLPLLESEPLEGWDTVFASHVQHESTMYYPMRVVRSRINVDHPRVLNAKEGFTSSAQPTNGVKNFRLIHNLNNRAPYPIAGDIYPSPTYQDLLNHSHEGVSTHWFKDLQDYYFRPEFELYDLDIDPLETTNLAENTRFQDVFKQLAGKLNEWQNKTVDPWICYPHGIRYKGGCCELYNFDDNKFGFMKQSSVINGKKKGHRKYEETNKIKNSI